MEKDDIHLSDWRRILFGQAPPEFLLEVFIRTAVIYILLLIVVRWLGKRMSGQLTILELAVMLTLGAVVSPPMQVPDRGLSQGVILLICLLALQRGISLIGYLNTKFENLTQGKVNLLIKDGVLQLEAMKNERVSREQIFAQLRLQKIYNLGNVQRMYIEACGIFSIYKSPKSQPGLPILPKDDHDISGELTHRADVFQDQIVMVCTNCGFIRQNHEFQTCPHCKQIKWQPAIINN
ncbi:MAG TPA: YetF domain-containing protein [Mucilaginibacter sp.]